MSYQDGPTRTFPNNAAVGKGIRVVQTAGYLVAAGAHADDLGVMEYATLAANEEGTVRLASAAGTQQMVASAAITAPALVYGAASGKVSATANGKLIGLALTSATADGDYVEVLRLSSAKLTSTVEAKIADYTVTASDSGKTFTTVGASGTVVFALPAAVVGLKYRFRVGAAQELRIDPDGTEVIALPSTGVAGAAGKYLTANADGETVEIECTKAGTWSVFGFTGTWTAEA